MNSKNMWVYYSNKKCNQNNILSNQMNITLYHNRIEGLIQMKRCSRWGYMFLLLKTILDSFVSISALIFAERKGGKNLAKKNFPPISNLIMKNIIIP